MTAGPFHLSHGGNTLGPPARVPQHIVASKNFAGTFVGAACGATGSPVIPFGAQQPAIITQRGQS